MSHQQFKDCIDACVACAVACSHCATECLKEDDEQFFVMHRVSLSFMLVMFIFVFHE